MTSSRPAPPPFGGSALLRVAGCPIRFWLDAASPELFRQIRQLNQTEDQYRALGERVADRLGRDVVPDQRLSRDERAMVLRVRRQLHNGRPIGESDDQSLMALARCTDRLSADLIEAMRMSAELAALKDQVDQALEREQTRLPVTACELVERSPVARAMLRWRRPLLAEQLERLSRGASGDRKQVRHAGEQIWPMIDRAATRSTPRDWHGHVALLPIVNDGPAITALAVSAMTASHWMENIHARQQSGAERLASPDPALRLTVAPLHWSDDGDLQCWVVDPEGAARMIDVRMRRTSLLEAIYTALKPGPASLGDLEQAMLDDDDEEQRDLLRQFVAYLASVGVVQATTPPRQHLGSWRTPDSATAGDAAAPDIRACHAGEPGDTLNRESGYLDVYRQVTSAFPRPVGLRIQRQITQALRVLTVMTADRASRAPSLTADLDDGPVSLLDLLKQRVAADESPRLPWRRSPDWSPAIDNSSPYAQLLGWIAARADDGAVVDISETILDEFNAPNGSIDWPIDCLVRLPGDGASFDAVLDQIFLAGSMDARFVPALRQLHGEVAQADRYQQFLELLEREAGVTFVEVLIPPLSIGAANAVRRPGYTCAWTGDPDLQMYCDLNGNTPRYIPLDAITLRRAAGRLIAETDGQIIFPVYHATRTPPPPWNLLAEFLFSSTPRPIRWSARQLLSSLDAFPDRCFMPRMTVDGGLVLSCAQWRIPTDQLWDTNTGLAGKARALDRLRQSRGLPRWVFISGQSGEHAVPVDLESLRAIRAIELAVSATDGGLLMVEMLPAPDQLLVADQAHEPTDRLVSELLLRLPFDESPQEMVARIAPWYRQLAR